MAPGIAGAFQIARYKERSTVPLLSVYDSVKGMSMHTNALTRDASRPGRTRRGRSLHAILRAGMYIEAEPDYKKPRVLTTSQQTRSDRRQARYSDYKAAKKAKCEECRNVNLCRDADEHHGQGAPHRHTCDEMWPYEEGDLEADSDPDQDHYTDSDSDQDHYDSESDPLTSADE